MFREVEHKGGACSPIPGFENTLPEKLSKDCMHHGEGPDCCVTWSKLLNLSVLQFPHV